MPLNQFNIKPSGITYNGQEQTSGSRNYGYYDDYYLSPTYSQLKGGVGAGNSSLGLRATSNNTGLGNYSEEYERALGELAATLAFNGDTTQVNKYVAPTRSYSYKPSPQYITLDNVETDWLYRLGDVNDEILKAQLVMKANGYDVDATGVYDTKFADAMSTYKADNARANTYANTYGNKTIDVLNNATNKVTVDEYNKALASIKG